MAVSTSSSGLAAESSGVFPSNPHVTGTVTWSAGELVILFVVGTESVDIPTVTIGGNATTKIGQALRTDGGSAWTVAAFYFMPGSGGSGTASITNDAIELRYCVRRYTGHNASAPIVASSQSSTTGASGVDNLTTNQPDMADTTNNLRVVVAGAGRAGPSSATVTAPWSEVVDYVSSPFFDGMLYVAEGRTNTDVNIDLDATGDNGYGVFGFEIAASGGGGLSITADTVTTGESVPNPQLNLQVSAGTVATGESVPNPSLTQVIAAGTVASGALVEEPRVAEVVALGTVATGESVPSPQVNHGIALDTVASGEEFFAPMVATDAVAVFPELIESSEVVYSPQVNVGLFAGTINTGEVVPDPTLVPGGVTLLAGAIGTAEAFYAPSLALMIAAGTVGTGESVPSPVIANGGQIVLGTVASGESIPNPQLNLRVLAGTTTTGEVFYQPIVAFTLQVFAGTVLPPAYLVHEPTVTRDAVPFQWGPTEFVRPFPMGKTSATFGGPRLRTRSS